MERGVLSDHLTQGKVELFAVRLVSWKNRDRDHGLWEYHRLERGRVVLVGKRMAGADILQTHDGHDITRLRGIDHASIIRVHLTDTSNTFGLTRSGVNNSISLVNRSRIDSSERQSAEAIVHDLESEGSNGPCPDRRWRIRQTRYLRCPSQAAGEPRWDRR